MARESLRSDAIGNMLENTETTSGTGWHFHQAAALPGLPLMPTLSRRLLWPDRATGKNVDSERAGLSRVASASRAAFARAVARHVGDFLGRTRVALAHFVHQQARVIGFCKPSLRRVVG